MNLLSPSIKKSKKIFDIFFPPGKIIQDLDNEWQFSSSESTPQVVQPKLKHVFASVGVLSWMFMIKWLLDFLGLIGEILFYLLIPLCALSQIIGELEKINDNAFTVEQSLSRARILEIFLTQLIYVGYTFFSFRGFIGHTILADYVATDIGWATGNLFQTELAFYQLGVGVMGLMCLWRRDSLWIGIIYVRAVFLFGAASVHIWDIIVNQNLAHGNTGVTLFISDLLIPIIALILLYVYRKQPNCRIQAA
ncbi:MAG: hypothetical protein GY870_06270 [archaeon]|nr:hypothetical protein [archaeon]